MSFAIIVILVGTIFFLLRWKIVKWARPQQATSPPIKTKQEKEEKPSHETGHDDGHGHAPDKDPKHEKGHGADSDHGDDPHAHDHGHGHDHEKKGGCWSTIWKIIKLISKGLVIAAAFGGTLYWLYAHEFIWENAPKKIHHVATEADAKKVFWQWKMFDSKGKVVKSPSGKDLAGTEMTVEEMTRSFFEFSYGIGGQSYNRVVFKQIIALGERGTWSCEATKEHGVWEVKPLDYDPTRPGRGFRAYIWDNGVTPTPENAYELLALPSDVLRPSAM